MKITRLSWLLWAMALLLAACQPARAIPTPPAPADVLAASPARATPLSPAHTPDRAPLDNFLAALDWLNAVPAFSFESQCTDLMTQTVKLAGQPNNESSRLVVTTDTGARSLVAGQPNVAVQRSVAYRGFSQGDDLRAEIRLVDGQVFVLADYAQLSANHRPPMPGGWVPLHGITTLAYWPGLDSPAFSNLLMEYKGDAWSLVAGAPADRYRRALTSALDSISQAAGELDDGSPAQVITAVLKPDALPELWRWVDFNQPLVKKALATVHGTPLTIQMYLDQAGRPVALDFKVTVDVVDLDPGGLEDAPAGATLSLHTVFQDRVKIRAADTVKPAQAPASGEMAAWPAFSGPDQGFPYQTLGEFDQRLNQAAESGQMDGFWKEMSSFGVPLIFGDRVVFLYHGQATEVKWTGDWDDRARIAGRQVGDASAWWATMTLPLDARLEYLVQADEQPAMIDPLNPNRETGGLGTKSVVVMPDYVPPAFVRPRADVAKGQVSENLTIESRSLGYPVHYRVYTPAGYEMMSQLPVAYVTDGQDFLQFGKFDVALDNLIADHKMRPVIAVFIDPRDLQTGKNLREQQFLDNPKYADFIVSELPAVIDAAYRTNATAEGRAIVGFSYGGYFGADFALHHADTFSLVGLFSPVIAHNMALIDAYRQAGRLPLKFFISTGTWSDLNYSAGLFEKALADMGYPVRYLECNEGHSFGNIRGKYQQMLEFLFPAVSK